MGGLTPPEVPARIFLVGFAGCGKTTVGRELARMLAFRFFDMDEELHATLGATPRKLFESGQGILFRQEEWELLKKVVCWPRVVAALGSGTFCYQKNRLVIKAAGGVTVFLNVPWSVIVRRLPSKMTDRFGTDIARLESEYHSRIRWYREADIQIDLTGAENPTEAARMLIGALVERMRCDT